MKRQEREARRQVFFLYYMFKTGSILFFFHWLKILGYTFGPSFWKAEEASRESRQSKQDRYSEVRRLKEEEREARERMLVSQ